MTSKLKCPYCSAYLESTTGGWEYGCTNTECQSAGTLCGTEELWQALIQAKQDLEHAEDTIVDLNTTLERTIAKYAQSQKSAEIARQALKNSREKLAAFMHDVWGNWFAYQLNNSTIENLQRWGIQSNTPYSSLTETDKDKDRKFADKIIAIIKEQIEHKE